MLLSCASYRNDGGNAVSLGEDCSLPCKTLKLFEWEDELVTTITDIATGEGYQPYKMKADLENVKITAEGDFADMRGTEEVPIWTEPYPLLYATNDAVDWKRRKAIRFATRELDFLDVQYRFSFYDDFEHDGLYFGPEETQVDGFCKMCNQEIKDGARESGLFCSERCEEAFSQLQEMVAEESKQRTKCQLCGKPLDIFSPDAIIHHISYTPERTIHVCRSCHRKILSNIEKYPELAPKRPPGFKRDARDIL